MPAFRARPRAAPSGSYDSVADVSLAANRLSVIDVPVGRCVYTQFLNPRGGIEADLTVTRLAADRFLVLTAAFTQTHVEAWIRNHAPADACCVLTDVSGAYAMLNVQGPASRALLGALSPDDFSDAAFPFATCREIHIGYQTVLAVRLTYVGELGWELYVPTPFALPVYDAQGKRDLAVAQYKKVLDMKEYETSHTDAKRYLETPYRNN